MCRHLFAFTLLAIAGPALAVDGLGDSSFGIFSSGRNVISTDAGGNNIDTLTDVLVNTDGSILLVGTARVDSNQRFSITKLTPSGTVDDSFGVDGTVFSASTTAQAKRARLDANGNIVIVGTISFGGNDKDFYLCRYNPLGQPQNFSALGSHCRTVAFDINGGNATDQANDFRIDTDGRITIAGIAGFSNTSDFAALARINPDGELDTSFSTDGKIIHAPVPNALNHFNALALRPDGKFYAVGEAGDPATANGTSALFARLTYSGNLDPTFQGGQGFTLYTINAGDAFNRDESATSLERLSDGRLLMGGTAENGQFPAQQLAFIIKILPADFASVDGTFGNTGRLYVAAGYSFELGDLMTQSDGKIILIGSRRATNISAPVMHVVRVLPGGDIDGDGFGTVGRTDIDFFLPGDYAYGRRVASQNGRLIVAGDALNTLPGNFDLTVARLSNDLIFANGID